MSIKVATPFTLQKSYQHYADEYNILYKKETATLEKLISFCETYSNNRINIEFEDELEISHLVIVNKIHPMISVRINSPEQANKIAELKEKNINFFFDYKFLPCYSNALLDMMVSLGVSDIYISDSLCYNLSSVKNICSENNIQVRAILNVIPQITNNRGSDMRAPIFNPRDADELFKYLDVAEFDCGNPYDWHKFKVYHKAWFIKKDWYGDLRDINIDLDFPFQVPATVPGFLNRKFNCGRACSMGAPCHRCKDFFDLAQDFINERVSV